MTGGPNAIHGVNIRRLNESGKRLCYRIATIIRTAKIHAMDNKAMDYSLKVAVAASNEMVDDLGELTVFGEDETIHINDFRIRFELSLVSQVAAMNRHLHQRGVGGFKVVGTTTIRDWRYFVTTLAAAPVLQEDVSDAESLIDGSAKLNALLGDEGVDSIRFSQVMFLRQGTLGGMYGGEGESVRIAASRALQLYLRALRVVESMRSSSGGKRMHLGVSRIVQYLVDQAYDDPRQHLALVNLKSDTAYELRHPVNSLILAIGIGRRLGLSRASLLDLGLSALTCDLGMESVPEEIRTKPGELTAEELEVLQRHPVRSVMALMEGVRMGSSARRWMTVAFEHHIGFDQSGYPSPIKWPNQHLFSRIISVSETYDALTTSTPWRDGLLPDEALEIMMRDAGKDLDPGVVTTLVNMLGRFPLGSALLLSTGEVGVVYSTPSEPEHVLRPVVRLVLDSAGERVASVEIVDLRERSEGGDYLRDIVRAVDPQTLGLDATRALYR
jgi:HD-GYP domain-containing protein (c-di-GMP phosphodiesterase class II)